MAFKPISKIALQSLPSPSFTFVPSYLKNAPPPSFSILDLFCGAGGASTGYALAGFAPTGVDIIRQKHYPSNFPFYQRDFREFFDLYPPTSDIVQAFDVIHASPPCQHYSKRSIASQTHEYQPDYINELRDLLLATGLPYVIENLPTAPLIYDKSITLCGASFNLGTATHRLKRHRLFESNIPLLEPPCGCATDPRPIIDVGGGGPNAKLRVDGSIGGSTYKGNAQEGRITMQTPWMNRDELKEAIPPAYTQFIGTQLVNYLTAEEVKTNEYSASTAG